MAYTEQMRRAFHSIRPPKGFYVDVIDNEHFLTVRIDEKVISKLPHDDKIAAVQYVMKVKAALEDNGAVVLVARKALT